MRRFAQSFPPLVSETPGTERVDGGGGNRTRERCLPALTASEREIALNVFARSGDDARRCGNLLLEAYDGQVARAARLEAALEEVMCWDAAAARRHGARGVREYARDVLLAVIRDPRSGAR